MNLLIFRRKVGFSTKSKMGINELPIDKSFMKEHGENKKKLKVSWAEYIKILRNEESTKLK